MPYEVATTAIEAAIIAILDADTALTALLAEKPSAKGGGPAIYKDGEVATGQLFPYLTIGAWTQTPFHSLSPNSDGFGWNCTGQLKAVSQRQSQNESVMSAVFGALEQGLALAIGGYDSAWCDEFNLQPTFKSTIAGVTTYETPAILRVYAT